MSTIYCLLDDKKRESGVKTFLEKDEALFREWNEKGWGVYFSVNEFNGRRTTDCCTKLRYVYADLDIAKAGDGQTREQRQAKKKTLLAALQAKAKPTLVIDTSNGLQPLWEITDNEPNEANKIKYSQVIKGIVDWSKQHGCAADKVYDCSRILRLRGYYHQKEEPYLCDFISQTAKKYSLDELGALFPYEENVVVSVIKPSNAHNPLFSAIESLNFRELIIKAFASTGRPVSFDVSGHLLDPVGKTTGTFIGRKGNRDYLASSSHEPFEGNRITAVADILKVDYSDAYKWICQEYNLDFKKLIEGEKVTKQLAEIKEKPKVKNDIRYTWGTRNLNIHFAIIKPNNFIVVAAKRNSGKTTFTFNMALKNAEIGNKVLYISLEMDTEDILDDFGRKYAGITIEEEYDIKIPESKEVARKWKKDKIKEQPNLFLEGVRRSGDIGWELVQQIIKKHEGIDMVFIDNLDLIAGKEGETDWSRQKRLVTQMMAFTSENQVPIILVHHYRKSGTGKDQGMDELSGSGKIGDGADRVIKVVRSVDPEAVYPEMYKSTVYLQKGRGYPEYTAQVYFIKGTFLDDPPMTEEYYGIN